MEERIFRGPYSAKFADITRWFFHKVEESVVMMSSKEKKAEMVVAKEGLSVWDALNEF